MKKQFFTTNRILRLLDQLKEIDIILDDQYFKESNNQRIELKTSDLMSKGKSVESHIENTLHFSISYKSGQLIYIDVYPDGSGSNKQRAQRLNEPKAGIQTFGSIKIDWCHISDDSIEKKTYEKTIQIGNLVYTTFDPEYGFSYYNEVSNPEYFNLIPTEFNILSTGPRDCFDINYWGPRVAKMSHYERLEGETNLNIKRFQNGGALIFINPENFVKGEIVERQRSEEILGWITPRKKGQS